MEGHVVDLGYNVYTRELQLALAFRSFLSAFVNGDSGVHFPPRGISTRVESPSCPLPTGPSSFPSPSSSVSPCTPGKSTDLFKRRSRREAAGSFTKTSLDSLISLFNFNFYFRFLSPLIHTVPVYFFPIIYIHSPLHLPHAKFIRVVNSSPEFALPIWNLLNILHFHN